VPIPIYKRINAGESFLARCRAQDSTSDREEF
jgi:hypothetical protein